MSDKLKKFLFREAILTLVVIVIGLIFFTTFLKDYYKPVYFIILAIVSILSAIFYRGLLKSMKYSTSKFISNFMLISGIKIMVYLVFLIYYVFTFKENAVNFLIVFLVLYLIYTFFDVYSLIVETKTNKKSVN
ncbi:MAG: hypothetical protein PF487_00635 [Bacteroidales bacterium]|jgi:hypothetical protein|nr:hypothetical protein [Bacteroidales bacterium]